MPHSLETPTSTAKSIATLWSIHIAATLLSYIATINEPATATILTTASIAAVHIAGAVTLNEIHNTLKYSYKYPTQKTVVEKKPSRPLNHLTIRLSTFPNRRAHSSPLPLF